MTDKLKMAAAKIIVSGTVQGVGFRYYIARSAEELGLKGYTKNLFNGNVEIYAEGRLQFVEERPRILFRLPANVLPPQSVRVFCGHDGAASFYL